MKYDKNSFLAGLIAGRQMKGWSAYGTMGGWDPDGDLIVRPITQGVPVIRFASDAAFSGVALTDTVNEAAAFPEMETEEITQIINVIAIADDTFSVLVLNERLEESEIIHAYTIDKDINPLEYDEEIVFIDSDGAFTMQTEYEEYSAVAEVSSGELQLLSVNTDRFETIESQEVSLC